MLTLLTPRFNQIARRDIINSNFCTCQNSIVIQSITLPIWFFGKKNNLTHLAIKLFFNLYIFALLLVGLPIINIPNVEGINVIDNTSK